MPENTYNSHKVFCWNKNRLIVEAKKHFLRILYMFLTPMLSSRFFSRPFIQISPYVEPLPLTPHPLEHICTTDFPIIGHCVPCSTDLKVKSYSFSSSPLWRHRDLFLSLSLSFCIYISLSVLSFSFCTDISPSLLNL